MRTRLIFSTPNADFLAESNADPVFRNTLLSCDMSVADGAPVVWLGRAIGAPIPMRVAGSSLLDGLICNSGDRGIRIFFFGGDKDMARLAHAALEKREGGAIAAGWLDPGFVSMDEMSTPDVLAKINEAQPDFLVVALGAKKGHEWIARNAGRLNATVISHLGAAIGFVAGTTKRSPRLMQALGFEWLWRMAMEPRLMRRYWRDFLFLLRTVFLGLVPVVLSARGGKGSSLCVVERHEGAARTLSVSGPLLGSTLSLLGDSLNRDAEGDVTLDISGVTDMDSSAIGYLYYVKYRAGRRVANLVCQPGSRAARLLGFHCARSLFS
ncbi:MAG: WecB/TagA/CpsF family glycosyltransferase [Steroidobacteraceae bacterium]